MYFIENELTKIFCLYTIALDFIQISLTIHFFHALNRLKKTQHTENVYIIEKIQ